MSRAKKNGGGGRFTVPRMDRGWVQLFPDRASNELLACQNGFQYSTILLSHSIAHRREVAV